MRFVLFSLWNAAYAVGWAAGPFVGGLLYQLFGDDFGSYASTVAIVGIAYGTIMVLAMCCPCCLAKERARPAVGGGAGDVRGEGGAGVAAGGSQTSDGSFGGATAFNRAAAESGYYLRTQRAQSSLHAFRKRAQTASAARVFSSFDVTEARWHVLSAVMSRRRFSSMMRRDEPSLGSDSGA